MDPRDPGGSKGSRCHHGKMHPFYTTRTYCFLAVALSPLPTQKYTMDLELSIGVQQASASNLVVISSLDRVTDYCADNLGQI